MGGKDAMASTAGPHERPEAEGGVPRGALINRRPGLYGGGDYLRRYIDLRRSEGGCTSDFLPKSIGRAYSLDPCKKPRYIPSSSSASLLAYRDETL